MAVIPERFVQRFSRLRGQEGYVASRDIVKFPLSALTTLFSHSEIRNPLIFYAIASV